MNLRDVILLLIVAVVACSVGVLAFNTFSESEETDYEYLECIPAEDFGEFDTVYGCADVVSIAGTSYLKMVDVGEFYVVSEGSTKKFTVGPARLDLFLQSGQSNAYFYSNPGAWPDGSSVTADPNPGGMSPVAPGKALIVGVDHRSGWYGGVSFPGSYQDDTVLDFTDSDGHVRVANTYPVFLADYIGMTGHRVIMLNAARGGMPISHFQPGQEEYEFVCNVLTHASELLDREHYTITPVGVLWSQGESDRTTDPEVYADRFIALVDNFCSGDMGIAFPHVYSSLPAYHAEGEVLGGTKGQMIAAERDDRITIANTLALDMPFELPYYRDGTHYTQMVNNWIGEAFARSVAAHLGCSTIPETIVICDEITADAIPSDSVTAIGTSGEKYTITVDRDVSGIDGAGTYTVTGVMTRTPNETLAAPGLEAAATITISD